MNTVHSENLQAAAFLADAEQALAPAERVALTVATAMTDRGEGLPPNIAWVITRALRRITGADR